MPHVLANDLRKSVLQAAFSGTLTERSSLDTPISITLKNAAKEAEALKIKHAKTSDNTDFPFDIPEEWAWCNLPDIGFSGLGKTLNGAKDKGEEKPYLCSINVYWAGVDLTTVKVARFSSSDIKKYRLKKGDLLTCEGGDVGRTIVWESDQEMYYQNALHRVRFFANNNQYYFRYLLMFYKLSGLLDNVSKGMTIKHFVQGALNNLPIPLPPIEEQSRIVARLDELMTKIDEYEKIENELTALHKKFPTDMKAAILQAAMQGKLSEQLSSDENVNEYYSNIQAHRTQLIKEKVLKKENCLKEPIKDIPFDIPETWMWCHLGDCIQLISGADLTSDEYNDKQHGIVYLTGASNIENGRIIINRWTETPRSIAKKGDLLLTCKGTVGKTCFLEIDEAHIARQIMAIRAIDINPQYMAAFIAYYVGKLQSMAKSMIPGIERANVLTAVFPLPPIEEQQRIVEKLDQLLPLCDQLADMAS